MANVPLSEQPEVVLMLAGAVAFMGAMAYWTYKDTKERYRMLGELTNPADDPDDVPPDLSQNWIVERATGLGEHSISAHKSPKADKLGLHTTNEHPVDGWNGVFVGDADDWIPVMVRDGYWNDTVWVYEIDFDALAAAGHDYWITEDPNVFDKTETPSSWLVLTKDKVVPAFAVKLKQRISRAESQRMYEDRYGSEEEDEGEDGGYY